MAVTKTGVNFEDDVFGTYFYGDGGVGTITVDNGDFEILGASDPNEEPGVSIGISGGDGTATITGTGTGVRLDSNGNSNNGARINIGDGATSTGELNVLAGSLIGILDTSGAAGSSATGGGESFIVGNIGTGVLNVDASTVLLQATGPFFAVGFDGGNGTANFLNGSTLTIQAATSHADDYTGVGVGERAGSTGQLNFNASTGTVTGLGDSEVFFNVGKNGGTGTVNFSNSSSFTLTGANAQFTGISVGQDTGAMGTININNSTLSVTTAQDQYFIVGRDGGTGTVNLDGGTLNLNGDLESSLAIGNAGTGTVSADNSSVLNFSSDTRVGINVGVDFDNVSAGNGTFELLGGSSLNVTDNAGGTDSKFNVNLGVKGIGTFTVDASTVSANVGGEIYLGIGREGGNGTFNVLNGSTVNLIATNAPFAGMSVGRDDANSVGDVNITDSTVTVTNNGGEAYFNIGRDNGTGTLNLDNGSLIFTGSTLSGIQSGRDGGTGNIDLANGSLLQFNAAYDSYFNFGRDGGQSTVDIDASTIKFVSTGVGLVPGETYLKSAGGNIGRDGTATVGLTNGSLFDIDAASEAYLNIGRGATGNGTFNLTSSALDIATSSATEGAFLNLGRDGGTGQLNADSSNINVISAGGFATMRLGMDFGSPGGSGTAILENGTAVTITGDTARLSVGYTANSSGDLQVLSGSTVVITDTGSGTEGSAFSVGYNPGTTSATALIDGTGSSVSGADYTIVGFNDPVGGLPGTGNGVLTITNGGSLSTDSVVIGDGGSLILGDSSIATVTGGTVFGQPTGMYVTGGEMRVLAGKVANISGNLAFLNNAGLTIEIASDGLSSGTINHMGLGNTVSADGTLDLTIDSSGYSFMAGEQFLLLTTTGIADFGTGTDVSVTDQDSQFAHFTYSDGTAQNVYFWALNNGDGTGARTFDFTDFSAAALELNYDTDTGRGTAENSTTASTTDVSGGVVYNIDKVIGTNENDLITLTGSGAAVEVDGGAGADTVNGGGGQDIINGGVGYDILSGNGGSDWLSAGADGGDMSGGIGADWFIISDISETNVVQDYDQNQGDIVYLSSVGDLFAWSLTGDDLLMGSTTIANTGNSDIRMVIEGTGALLGQGDTALKGSLLQNGVSGFGTATGLGFYDVFVDADDSSSWFSRLLEYNSTGQLVQEILINDDDSYSTTAYDINPASDVDRVVINYNSAQQTTSQQTYYDDGSRVLIIYDPLNAQTYQTVTNTYNAAGQQTQSVVLYDDTTSKTTFFDPTNAAAWTYVIQDKDTTGALTRTDQINDDGSRAITIYDPTDAQDYSNVIFTYNAAGDVTKSDIVYDDGTRKTTVYDPTDVQSYSTVIQSFNAAGENTRTDAIFDDGTRTITTYDPTDIYTYNYAINSYDSGGNLAAVNLYLDDGTRKETLFDTTSSELYSVRISDFNASSQLTKLTTYNDDSTRFETSYDRGTASWDFSTKVFDAASQLDTIYTKNDNGTAVFIDYDQDNSFAWSLRYVTFDASGNVLTDDYIV